MKAKDFLGIKAPAFVHNSQNRNDNYVSAIRIDELKAIASKEHDFARLIALCDHINRCHRAEAFLGIGVLVRALLDHVPPIFSFETFSEVANNYSGGARSFKDSIQHLENTSRKVADAILHTKIRNKESLPTAIQTDFRAALDVLLQEIVRIKKG